MSSIPVFCHTIIVLNPGNNLDISPNLQLAVNTAKNGDTLQLPVGTFTFTGTITTTKRLSIIGKGIANTILYRSETLSDATLKGIAFLKFDIDIDTSSGMIISDFTLKSKKPSEVDMDGNLIQTGSNATDYGIILNFAVDFIVTKVRFENFGYSALCITHRDNIARGLVYNCEFYHNFKFDGLGLGYGISIYGENLSWVTLPKFGSNNFIFIEDNTFEKHRHAICGGGCALYVCRYNSFKNHFLDATIDMHEARGKDSNTYASRATEIYNNSLSNDTYIDNTPVCDCTPWHTAGTSTGGNALSSLAIGIRGGETLIHDNYIAYYRSGICFYAIYHSETGDQNVYPLTSQIGYSSAIRFGINDSGNDAVHGDGDAYMWNNTLKPYGPGKTPYNDLFINYNSTLLFEERDFHFVAKPGYTSFTYPHPLRSKIISVVLVSSIVVSGTNGNNTISSKEGTLQLVTTIIPSNSTDKSLLWSISSGADLGSISSTGLLTAKKNGKLTVKVTALDGSGISGMVTITISNQSVITMINDTNDTLPMIYPNPCKDFIKINMKIPESTMVIFTIFDLSSKIRLQKILHSNSEGVFDLNFGIINSGIYILNIKSIYGTYSNKICIE